MLFGIYSTNYQTALPCIDTANCSSKLFYDSFISRQSVEQHVNLKKMLIIEEKIIKQKIES